MVQPSNFTGIVNATELHSCDACTSKWNDYLFKCTMSVQSQWNNHAMQLHSQGNGNVQSSLISGSLGRPHYNLCLAKSQSHEHSDIAGLVAIVR